MNTSSVTDSRVADFIARWQASGAAERANCQLFLTELCDVLGVANPVLAKPQVEDIEEILQSLVITGNARQLRGGK